MGNQELFCTEPTCGRVQPIQTKKLNLFSVFNIPQSYYINEKQLEASYKELQKKLHPDKFASKSIDEKNVSTTSSSAINFAYQVSFFLLLPISSK
jgi:molecular chaperone HscB